MLHACQILKKDTHKYALCLSPGMLKKFSKYITTITIILQTDHEPLIQILQSKPTDELTPPLQRFTPGKEFVPDASGHTKEI